VIALSRILSCVRVHLFNVDALIYVVQIKLCMHGANVSGRIIMHDLIINS
jgi:hypothetical protein